MTAPRLEIDLDKVRHNARTLVDRLAARGIAVTGITKATLGSPAVAEAMLRGGVEAIGDSRVENLEALRRGGVAAPMMLIRAPMLSQVERVVACAEVSCNTELATITALSSAARARRRRHGIVLMVELGDLREGIMPADLEQFVRATLRLPNLTLVGLGANLACQSGVAPGPANMAELSRLATSTENRFGIRLAKVSGGNSASLDWASGPGDTGRVTDLRLGESILLGREPLHRRPIEGLHTDACMLVAEVIESKIKPSAPWGELAQTAFGDVAPTADRGDMARTILAVGHQDVDPAGLVPPPGVEVLGASSDHLLVDAGPRPLVIGSELAFGLGYGALLRAATSPFVRTVHRRTGALSIDIAPATS